MKNSNDDNSHHHKNIENHNNTGTKNNHGNGYSNKDDIQKPSGPSRLVTGQFTED